MTIAHGVRRRLRVGIATAGPGSGSVPNGTRGTASRAVSGAAGSAADSATAIAAAAAASGATFRGVGADTGVGATGSVGATGAGTGTGATTLGSAPAGVELATRLVQPPSQYRHS